MTTEFIEYFEVLFDAYENDFNRFLISYLFVQMGFALTYRRIITKMEENTVNQNFEANWAQLG